MQFAERNGEVEEEPGGMFLVEFGVGKLEIDICPAVHFFCFIAVPYCAVRTDNELMILAALA